MEFEVTRWFLQRHADGGAGASAGGEGGATGAEAADAGQMSSGQNTPSAPEKLSFDELLKKDPEYKKAYDERVQAVVKNRFKTANIAEERLKKAAPLFEKLASKYGVQDFDDIDAIMKAADEDDSYYEAEALEKGVSVSELKRIKTLERENAEFRKREEEAKKQAHDREIYAKLMSGAEATKKMYPAFDLDTEMQNEQFARMVMGAGVPVQTAFEVIHKNEIMPAAMRYAAQKTASAAAQTIAAGRARPIENGATNPSATDTRFDPANLTTQQRREIIERAKRGEKISF
jgi:hypothetical protein